MDKNVSIFKDALHSVGVGDKIGRQISFIELHSLYYVESSVDRFCFLNGNCSVFSNFIHGFGDDVADFAVPICGNRSNLADFFAVFNGL